MKHVLRLTVLLLASSVLLASTGCTKKPQRPNPSQTVMGPGGGAGLTGIPVDSGLFDESASGLEGRDPSAMGADSQLRGVLKPVYFDFDSSAIRGAERAKLTEAKQYLDANPNARLLLEGHCDWRGTAEYNMGLGDRRASSVRDFLGDLGVPASRLETLSKGDLDATEGATETQMQEDRRVEVVVLR